MRRKVLVACLCFVLVICAIFVWQRFGTYQSPQNVIDDEQPANNDSVDMDNGNDSDDKDIQNEDTNTRETSGATSITNDVENRTNETSGILTPDMTSNIRAYVNDPSDESVIDTDGVHLPQYDTDTNALSDKSTEAKDKTEWSLSRVSDKAISNEIIDDDGNFMSIQQTVTGNDTDGGTATITLDTVVSKSTGKLVSTIVTDYTVTRQNPNGSSQVIDMLATT